MLPHYLNQVLLFLFDRREIEKRDKIDTRFPSAPESGSQTIHRSNGLNVKHAPRRKSHQDEATLKKGKVKTN